MEIKTLKDAIDRLLFMSKLRLKNSTQENLKSNQKDAFALNKMIDFINNANEKVVNENHLYCKLYADAIIENFRYYNYIEIANKRLNKKLDEPLEHKINKLAFELQVDYLTDYFENKGLKSEWTGIIFKRDIICLKTLKTHFEQNKDNILLLNTENKEIYSKIDFKEFQEVYNFWSYNKVFELFKTNAALSFNQFKN